MSCPMLLLSLHSTVAQAFNMTFFKRRKSNPSKVNPSKVNPTARERADASAAAKTARRKATPQPGDILLFNRARKWNRLITWFTSSQYYHVAIYQGDDHVVEARPRGVVCRDLNGPDGDKSYDVIAAPENRGAEALRWAQKQIGKRYGKSDVFVLIMERVFRNLKFNYQTRSQFSCGELVTCAFKNAGVMLFPDINAEIVVPADFGQLIDDK